VTKLGNMKMISVTRVSLKLSIRRSTNLITETEMGDAWHGTLNLSPLPPFNFFGTFLCIKKGLVDSKLGRKRVATFSRDCDIAMGMIMKIMLYDDSSGLPHSHNDKL